MEKHLSQKLISARVRKNYLIGALVEYHFDNYFAYGVVSHISESMGPLVRLHGKTYQERPEYFGGITNDTTFLSVFHNVKLAVRHPEVSVLDYVSLSPQQATFPRLRSGGAWSRNNETSEVKTEPWYIIESDGAFQIVPDDHPDLPQLSPRALHNITSIKFAFDHNLTPERSFLVSTRKLSIKADSDRN